jgi:F-type H+-transporting ATPase subunit gamma
MKLVSTAKLRRAEELAKRSRLFADKTNEMIQEIAFQIECTKMGGIDNRCFEKIETPKMVDIVFVTADKGLCGGFNIQTIKAVNKLMKEFKEQKVKFVFAVLVRKVSSITNTMKSNCLTL